MSSFDVAVLYLLGNEGGFVDNPMDHGGPTNFGITMHMLSFFRKVGVTADDVSKLTLDEAKAIYKAFFWDHLQLSELDQGSATALLDLSVNMSEQEMGFIAQAVLNYPVRDGILGSVTRKGIRDLGPKMFLSGLITKTLDHYCDIVLKNPSQIVFLKGWLRRAARLSTLLYTA